MSEPSSSYKDGEVVWVKWGNVWWPGEVYSSSRVPEDMTSSLRKPVIAFVKFLQEDSFELVRSNNNISKYNCDKKMENIKKGMDKYKTNKTMKENFSACITKAEQMTGGNVNILKSLETPTKSKSNPSTPDPVKKSVSQTHTPTTSAKKVPITPSTYNSSVKVQNTASAEQNKPNEKRLSCTMCPFTTDRMNLLMMHIKGHSLEIQSRVSGGSMIESRRPIIPKSTAARKIEVDDGIAEDVRKIKESMKEKSSPSPVPVGRKSKTATPKVEKATPKATKSRASKRGAKSVKEPSPEITQKEEVQNEEEEKPKVNEELKKELLADWLDDDDVVAPEKEKIETPKAPIVDEKPKQPIEKVSEKSSVPIRNIPKKQRVSEMYIQPESSTAPAVKEDNINVEEKTPLESSRKSQASQRKRKLNAEKPEVPQKVDDDKKMDIDEDEKLLMATAELLNEIEVPTKSSSVAESPGLDARAQSPSTTFQKSNDIDKRNLPPKERNKRIFRARNKSPENVETVASPPQSQVELSPIVQNDEQTTIESVKVVSVNKNDRQELMLPHKKKQSSRLLQPAVTEAIKNQPALEVVGGRKKKRKSSADVVGSEELPAPIVDILPQSPLRESQHESDEPTIDTEITTHNRGQKRHLSSEKALETEEPESKRFHKSSEPRTITCGANEAICITSKGTLAVARRDSLKTTQANSVVVTSQVIISEPIASPEVVTTASKSSSVVSLPQQALKNALKIPKENMEDFKKKGLLTVENNRTKLTPKGLQIFKEFQRDEKVVSNNNVVQTSSSNTSVLSNLSSATEDAPESIEEENNSQNEEQSSQNDVNEPMDVSDSIKEDVSDSLTKPDELNEDSKLESDQNGSQEVVAEEKEKEEEQEVIEVKKEEHEVVEKKENIDESPKETVDVAVDPVMPKEEEKEGEDLVKLDQDEPNELESQKKTEDLTEDIKKEEINEEKDQVEQDDSTEVSTKEEQEEEVKKPLENGSKEVKDEDVDSPTDDANTSSGAGLIALQAESFGGPPNCFYLCRQIDDDRYEPVDNQILVLNAQNALVPYEGEVLSDVALTPGADHSLGSENLSGYSQLSPHSNIIINTPNGQKVELNYFAIVALQESADENGVASMEYAGEQFELNINAILEAIAAQPDNDSSDGVPLIDGAVDANALILSESTDLPVDIKHSATQVSETLLSKPIMSTTVAPEIATTNPVMSTIAEKNLNIDDSLAAIGVTQTSRANVPKSLELPITVTNPTIAGVFRDKTPEIM